MIADSEFVNMRRHNNDTTVWAHPGVVSASNFTCDALFMVHKKNSQSWPQPTHAMYCIRWLDILCVSYLDQCVCATKRMDIGVWQPKIRLPHGTKCVGRTHVYDNQHHLDLNHGEFSQSILNCILCLHKGKYSAKSLCTNVSDLHVCRMQVWKTVSCFQIVSVQNPEGRIMIYLIFQKKKFLELGSSKF